MVSRCRAFRRRDRHAAGGNTLAQVGTGGSQGPGRPAQKQRNVQDQDWEKKDCPARGNCYAGAPPEGIGRRAGRGLYTERKTFNEKMGDDETTEIRQAARDGPPAQLPFT